MFDDQSLGAELLDALALFILLVVAILLVIGLIWLLIAMDNEVAYILVGAGLVLWAAHRVLGRL